MLAPDIFDKTKLKTSVRSRILETLYAAGLERSGVSCYLVGALATSTYKRFDPIQVVVCLNDQSASEFNETIGKYLTGIKLPELQRRIEFGFQNGIIDLTEHTAVLEIKNGVWFKGEPEQELRQAIGDFKDFWLDSDGDVIKAPLGHVPMAEKLLGQSFADENDAYDAMAREGYARCYAAYGVITVDRFRLSRSKPLTRAQIAALERMGIRQESRVVTDDGKVLYAPPEIREAQDIHDYANVPIRQAPIVRLMYSQPYELVAKRLETNFPYWYEAKPVSDQQTVISIYETSREALEQALAGVSLRPKGKAQPKTNDATTQQDFVLPTGVAQTALEQFLQGEKAPPHIVTQIGSKRVRIESYTQDAARLKELVEFFLDSFEESTARPASEPPPLPTQPPPLPEPPATMIVDLHGVSEHALDTFLREHRGTIKVTKRDWDRVLTFRFPRTRGKFESLLRHKFPGIRIARRKKEADRNKTSKICVMADFSPKDAKPILDVVRRIPDQDLYTEDAGDSYGPEYGRETETHVTVLYGLLPDEVTLEDVQKVVEGYGPIELTLGVVSKFRNDDKPYDVLKLEVESDDLTELNKRLSKLPNENDYPEYHPHVTLAYVQKGKSEDLVDDERFVGTKVQISELIFSPGGNEPKTTIPLGREARKRTAGGAGGDTWVSGFGLPDGTFIFSPNTADHHVDVLYKNRERIAPWVAIPDNLEAFRAVYYSPKSDEDFEWLDNLEEAGIAAFSADGQHIYWSSKPTDPAKAAVEKHFGTPSYSFRHAGETIREIAVQIGDMIYSGGRTHSECFRYAADQGADTQLERHDGFLTSTGRFVERAKAYRIAEASGQTWQQVEDGLLHSYNIRRASLTLGLRTSSGTRSYWLDPKGNFHQFSPLQHEHETWLAERRQHGDPEGTNYDQWVRVVVWQGVVYANARGAGKRLNSVQKAALERMGIEGEYEVRITQGGPPTSPGRISYDTLYRPPSDRSASFDPTRKFWLDPTGRLRSVREHTDVLPEVLGVTPAELQEQTLGERYDQAYAKGWVRIIINADNLYATGRPTAKQTKELKDQAIERELQYNLSWEQPLLGGRKAEKIQLSNHRTAQVDPTILQQHNIRPDGEVDILGRKRLQFSVPSQPYDITFTTPVDATTEQVIAAAEKQKALYRQGAVQLSNRQAQIYTGYWIDPNGKFISLHGQLEHCEWVLDNFPDEFDEHMAPDQIVGEMHARGFIRAVVVGDALELSTMRPAIKPSQWREIKQFAFDHTVEVTDATGRTIFDPKRSAVAVPDMFWLDRSGNVIPAPGGHEHQAAIIAKMSQEEADKLTEDGAEILYQILYRQGYLRGAWVTRKRLVLNGLAITPSQRKFAREVSEDNQAEVWLEYAPGKARMLFGSFRGAKLVEGYDTVSIGVGPDGIGVLFVTESPVTHKARLNYFVYPQDQISAFEDSGLSGVEWLVANPPSLEQRYHIDTAPGHDSATKIGEITDRAAFDAKIQSLTRELDPVVTVAYPDMKLGLGQILDQIKRRSLSYA